MKRIRLEFLKGIILVYFDFYGKNVKKKKKQKYRKLRFM